MHVLIIILIVMDHVMIEIKKLMCGSHGACLDFTWPGFKSPLGWDFHLCVQVI